MSKNVSVGKRKRSMRIALGSLSFRSLLLLVFLYWYQKWFAPAATSKRVSVSNIKEADRISSAASSPDHKIPRILIFTHRTDLLGPHADQQDLKFFDNVVDTIQMYAQDWRNESESLPVFVWFLDNDECIRVIEIVEPELVDYYQKESLGAYKGDICRGAALYLTGGFYFDVDMHAIAPVELPIEVTFSTALSYGTYFNSYMVASRNNSIVRDYLQILLYYYKQFEIEQHFRGRGKRNREVDLFFSRIPAAKQAIEDMTNKGLIGPHALAGSIQHHRADKENVVYFLSEQDMNDESAQKFFYPDLVFQEGGVGCCCNYLVHDRELNRPYFFSRFVGATKATCDYSDKTKQYYVPKSRPRLQPEIDSTGVQYFSWSVRNSTLQSLGVKFFHLPFDKLEI